MRATGGDLLELELNRFGNARHESAPTFGERQDDLAAVAGQLDESAGDRRRGRLVWARVGARSQQPLCVRQDTTCQALGLLMKESNGLATLCGQSAERA